MIIEDIDDVLAVMVKGFFWVGLHLAVVQAFALEDPCFATAAVDSVVV